MRPPKPYLRHAHRYLQAAKKAETPRSQRVFIKSAKRFKALAMVGYATGIRDEQSANTNLIEEPSLHDPMEVWEEFLRLAKSLPETDTDKDMMIGIGRSGIEIKRKLAIRKSKK